MNTFRRPILQILSSSRNHKSFSLTTVKSFEAYKSSIALENLHPKSSLKLTTPDPPPLKESEKFNGYIPIDELEITYSRSSGPGGQNVNKVNTKVDVRFNIEKSKWLCDEIKSRMNEKLKMKITRDGYVVFRSDITRSQQMNLADCLQKIRTCIRNCLEEKPPLSEETQEKIRRRIERQARERLAIKRQRSQLKSDRRGSDIQL